jgi:hypothetical protein
LRDQAKVDIAAAVEVEKLKWLQAQASHNHGIKVGANGGGA